MRDSEKIYEYVFGKTFSDYKLPDLENSVPFQLDLREIILIQVKYSRVKMFGCWWQRSRFLFHA